MYARHKSIDFCLVPARVLPRHLSTTAGRTASLVRAAGLPANSTKALTHSTPFSCATAFASVTAFFKTSSWCMYSRKMGSSSLADARNDRVSCSYADSLAFHTWFSVDIIFLVAHLASTHLVRQAFLNRQRIKRFFAVHFSCSVCFDFDLLFQSRPARLLAGAVDTLHLSVRVGIPSSLRVE